MYITILKIITILILVGLLSIQTIKRFLYFKPSNLNFGIPEGFKTVNYKKLLGISRTVGDKNKIILFLPDFTENFTFYNNHMEFLARAGYDSITYNYSGFNTPGIPSESQLIKDCKDMVISLLEKYHLQNIIIFGNGMSSFLAMYTAMEFKMNKVIIKHPVKSINQKLGKHYPKIIFNEFNILEKCSSYKGSILCFSNKPLIGFEKYNIEYYDKQDIKAIEEFINSK